MHEMPEIGNGQKGCFCKIINNKMPRGFIELSSTVESIYKDLGLLEEFILSCIKNKWSEIVGEGLSFHSEPSVLEMESY